MKIIQENEYLDTMKNEVEPYLKAHCRDGYIPGAEDIYHEKNGIIGKIHVKRYLADDPKGVVVISHGFTEGAPKYEEMIYYFLQAGYHVYMPEHMGHGQSYRLTADPSLVYIDIWKRYVRDFLKVCHEIKRVHQPAKRKTISPDLCTILWLAEGSHKNELVFKIPRLAETPVSSAHFPGRKRRFRIRPRTSEIRSENQKARCCPLRVCLHARDEA